MMADNQLNDVGGDDFFVYTGGEQQVPRDVKRVRIAENVDTIPARTFEECRRLIEVLGHKKIRKIEERAFLNCLSLRRVRNMQGVKEIEADAFKCLEIKEDAFSNWSELDFDKLEIIGDYAFYQAFFRCAPVHINMPSIRRVGYGAFMRCKALTDVVFGKDLERIKQRAFLECTSLRRVAIPLKYGLIVENEGFYGCQSGAFHYCQNLSRIDT
jgi:hypothetical protein